MDRNIVFITFTWSFCVALRKESVDRNSRGMSTISYTTVALRKESVDRNSCALLLLALLCVALRKESVDRNRHYRDDVPN